MGKRKPLDSLDGNSLPRQSPARAIHGGSLLTASPSLSTNAASAASAANAATAGPSASSIVGVDAAPRQLFHRPKHLQLQIYSSFFDATSKTPKIRNFDDGGSNNNNNNRQEGGNEEDLYTTPLDDSIHDGDIVKTPKFEPVEEEERADIDNDDDQETDKQRHRQQLPTPLKKKQKIADGPSTTLNIPSVTADTARINLPNNPNDRHSSAVFPTASTSSNDAIATTKTVEEDAQQQPRQRAATQPSRRRRRRSSPNDMDCSDSDIDSVFELASTLKDVLCETPVIQTPTEPTKPTPTSLSEPTPTLEHSLLSLFAPEAFESSKQATAVAATDTAVAATAFQAPNDNAVITSTTPTTFKKLPSTPVFSKTLLREYRERPADDEQVVQAMLATNNGGSGTRRRANRLDRIHDNMNKVEEEENDDDDMDRDAKGSASWIGRSIGGEQLERSESLDHSVLTILSVTQAPTKGQPAQRRERNVATKREHAVCDNNGGAHNPAATLPYLNGPNDKDDEPVATLEEDVPYTPNVKPKFDLASLRPQLQQQGLKHRSSLRGDGATRKTAALGEQGTVRGRRHLTFSLSPKSSDNEPAPSHLQDDQNGRVEDDKSEEDEEQADAPPSPQLQNMAPEINVDANDLLGDNEEQRGHTPIWSQTEAGIRSHQFQLHINGKKYRHPELPSGWQVMVSESRSLPYYCHPVFGITWHCPIVLPRGSNAQDFSPRSVCSFSIETRRGSTIQGSVDGGVEADMDVDTDSAAFLGEVEDAADNEENQYQLQGLNHAASSSNSTTTRSGLNYDPSGDDSSLEKTTAVGETAGNTPFRTPFSKTTSGVSKVPLSTASKDQLAGGNPSTSISKASSLFSPLQTPGLSNGGQVVHIARQVRCRSMEAEMVLVTPKQPTSMLSVPTFKSTDTTQKNPPSQRTSTAKSKTPGSAPWSDLSMQRELITSIQETKAKSETAYDPVDRNRSSSDVDDAGTAVTLTSIALRQHEEVMFLKTQGDDDRPISPVTLTRRLSLPSVAKQPESTEPTLAAPDSHKQEVNQVFVAVSSLAARRHRSKSLFTIQESDEHILPPPTKKSSKVESTPFVEADGAIDPGRTREGAMSEFKDGLECEATKQYEVEENRFDDATTTPKSEVRFHSSPDDSSCTDSKLLTPDNDTGSTSQKSTIDHFVDEEDTKSSGRAQDDTTDFYGLDDNAVSPKSNCRSSIEGSDVEIDIHTPGMKIGSHVPKSSSRGARSVRTTEDEVARAVAILDDEFEQEQHEKSDSHNNSSEAVLPLSSAVVSSGRHGMVTNASARTRKSVTLEQNLPIVARNIPQKERRCIRRQVPPGQPVRICSLRNVRELLRNAVRTKTLKDSTGRLAPRWRYKEVEEDLARF